VENKNLGSTQSATLIKSSGDRPKNLKANPFTTYRDPQTGRWIVVKPAG